MNKCLTCGGQIEQKKGKRTRLYCSDLCRVRHFQKHGKQTVKKIESKTTPAATPVIEPNEAILNQIAVVRAELIPIHRNTTMGRKTWLDDQQKRIIELESKLK